MRRAADKLVSLPDAVERVRRWRTAGDVVVFAHGMFDLPGVDHARALAAARARGTRLVAAVMGDAAAAALAGPGRPVMDEVMRARVIAALRAVDLVVVFHDRTPATILRSLAPDLDIAADAPAATTPGAGGLYERVRARHARGG